VKKRCYDSCYNPALMTKPLNIATYALLGLGSFLAQAQTHNSAECVSQGETIYTVGEDHVKPPNVQVVNSVGHPLPKITSSVLCEVLINSKGRICDIRIVKAPDRQTARQVGVYIGETFRFTPATRAGKSVAAKVPIVFDSSGKFTLSQ
jgi:hypothetical protein